MIMKSDNEYTLAYNTCVWQKKWLNRSRNPHFNLSHARCVYKPMLELLSYLRTEGLNVYIVAGGDEDYRCRTSKKYL